MDVQARTAANRRRLAEFFDGLDEGQLATRSLCADWTIRDVLGHLVATMTGSLRGLLRDRADEHGSAPGVGPMGQLADGCLHLRDCARPLGLADDVGLEDWRLLLDRLPNGVPGLVPRKRVAALALRATDQGWTWGSGAEVSGPSEALALAVAGRGVALDDLTGPGVGTLRARLGGC